MIRILRLLRFTGRADRAEYWTVSVVGWAIIASLRATVATSHVTNPAVDLVVLLPILAILMATSARRLHDRGKTAWWLMLFTVAPAVISTFSRVVELETHATTATSPGSALI